MLVLPARERPLPDALGLAMPLLRSAVRDRVPWMMASVVAGPAVVLGAAQRAGSVVKLDACAGAGVAVRRRATAGTAVYVGRHAIVWTIALPHPAAIVADATPRTLLNRNVRSFLRGLSRLGAPAHYFGREWVSARKQPAAVMGFEATEEGAAVIEIIAGVDAPPALPDSLVTDDERAVDRWLGKTPIALAELSKKEPLVIAGDVLQAMAQHAAASTQEAPTLLPDRYPEVEREDDPIPPGFVLCPKRRAPIGWIESAWNDTTRQAWLGGDVIAPSYVLRAIGEGRTDVGDAPIEGASIPDLVSAAESAGQRFS